MIKRLAHVCLHTADLEKTARFYFDVLGLEKGFTFEKNGEPFGFYVNVGNDTFLEVFKGKPGAGSFPLQHLCFEVDSIDTVSAALQKQGFEVTEKQLGSDHSWQAWTRDPNGIPIEFHEYTKDSMQYTGGVCQVNW